MNNQEFNQEKKVLNKKYLEIFGVVPCMQQFDCSREEYIGAMKQAIITEQRIEMFLREYGQPLDKNALT